ncbi:M10 family metallopeptidase C-terminal domain-containing protein, partial [Sphingomonas sp.]|uniref:M10 family metallopeptidase C-terminal domain-containing protein n=1 Tax=Sphingomonas sp. TaxID=28214 RepID=UPI00286EB212
MVDIPGSASTTATISVGGTVDGSLESVGDHDWFRITLTAGQSISVALSGIGAAALEDAYIRIRDAAGNIIFENDDSGPGRDSLLGFSAPSSGTYFIDVGAFDDAYAGDYRLSVSAYTPPPLATFDQIAGQLVSGYWEGSSHHFDVTQGGSLSVNLTALTESGQYLAREALALWSDIIGVNFVEVATGGQITFDDNEEGAFSTAVWSSGITSSAHVNVSTQWLEEYGTTLDTYSMQTYIHEIGHALGLGHAGHYNGDATYPFDAIFRNDAWSTSVMSYFSQSENTHFAGQGFTQSMALTPMSADILAMAQLYGLSTTTRTGDTSYGFSNNTDRYIYGSTLNAAVTIFDNGGIDTLDYSGSNADQLINLNPETYSNVGIGVGNLTIARGVVIENASSGGANDRLIGNSANNVFSAGAGHNIIDGGGGSDTAIFLDSGVTVSLAISGPQNTRTLGSDTLISIENLVGWHDGDTLTGNAGANTIDGGGGPDTLRGGDGDDVIFGGYGHDYIDGGNGTDTASFADDGNGGVVVDLRLTTPQNTTISEWYDTLVSIENLIGSVYADRLTGNSSSNTLYGGDGDDSLDGGSGNDTLHGGSGVDTASYASASAGVVVSFAVAGAQNTVGAGTDTLLAFENIAGSNFNDTLTGNGGANTLSGNAGNDTLNGGAGVDTMAGGAGNDWFYVDAAADAIVEGAGGGTDRVLSAVTYALNAGSAVELVTTTNAAGTGALNLTGNEFG